jgi:cell wall-associated NlpC family hydrolase
MVSLALIFTVLGMPAFFLSASTASAAAQPHLTVNYPLRYAPEHQPTVEHLVIVKHGDSLSSIAKRVLGNSHWWPQIFWRNTRVLRGSTTLYAGTVLHFGSPWAHRPKIPAKFRVRTVSVAAGSTGSAPVSSSPPPASYGGGGVGGAFGACVRAAESGGNYQIWNASGHYGAYQFSEATWIAYGGSAASFGHASPALQDQVFMNAMSTPGGYLNWQPYDHCVYTASAVAGTEQAQAVKLVAHRSIAHPHHPVRHHGRRRLRAFRWALAQRGKWYAWGGTGPSTFDCSGLVMESWLHGGGVQLERTTTDMLYGGHLVRVTGHPQRGDLAFWGTGHVELYDRWGWTLGAAHTGTRVGFHHWSGYWHPTSFWRIA